MRPDTWFRQRRVLNEHQVFLISPFSFLHWGSWWIVCPFLISRNYTKVVISVMSMFWDKVRSGESLLHGDKAKCCHLVFVFSCLYSNYFFSLDQFDDGVLAAICPDNLGYDTFFGVSEDKWVDFELAVSDADNSNWSVIREVEWLRDLNLWSDLGRDRTIS